jgi:hypothetical protein
VWQGTLLPGVFWDDFAVLTLFSPRTGLTAAVLKLQVRVFTARRTLQTYPFQLQK